MPFRALFVKALKGLLTILIFFFFNGAVSKAPQIARKIFSDGSCFQIFVIFRIININFSEKKMNQAIMQPFSSA